ncbi:Endoribonuclease YbeY [Frankliniella fusca]|uniref:Endoribonuclease YbeY n=1 Tax=Frankliniella fusca TaxID=407009 RepID=A0AAE1H2W2_9NEOP|nr:Endoribonuclease YbeY [Frankliniella fusca]
MVIEQSHKPRYATKWYQILSTNRAVVGAIHGSNYLLPDDRPVCGDSAEWRFFFPGEFELSTVLKSKIRELNVFFETIYLKYWYAATDSVSAPRLDLELLQSIAGYEVVSKKISEVAMSTFKNHLWYLSAHCVAIAFFETKVPTETKVKMVANLQTQNKGEKREYRFVSKNPHELVSVDLSHFVSETSTEFFKILDLNSDFLEHDPSSWPTLQSFNEGQQVIMNLNVVNDCAERAVAIVKEFNNSITRTETDYQNILLVCLVYI